MDARKPSDSAVETTHLVLPPDTNHHGTAFGGIIMQWMDIAAGIAAARHCRTPVVTVAVDDLLFARPIRVGDVVIIKGCVNYAGKTSMEVGIRVDREDAKSREPEHCLTGYFTFVAIDQDGQPVAVPQVVPDTPTEKRRYEAARVRREERLAKKARG